MEREFTLLKYKKLLDQFPKGNFTVKGAIINKNQIGIIRHDVDRPPKNVLKIAEIENKLGIQSTYYFRVSKKHFRPDIITKVKSFGHEIGYHYEVLDKAYGDIEKAFEIFNKEWALFTQWNSSTICAHGNPRTIYNNLNIWKFYNIQEFGIIGEAYLSIDFRRYFYFSDVGRKWNFRFNEKLQNNLKIKTVDQLADLIMNNHLKNIYILIHPSRWNDEYFPWLKELIFQYFKNKVKRVLKYLRT